MSTAIQPFLVLLIAHLIGDFVLQTEQMALKKGYVLFWLAVHSTIVAAITWLLCWRWDMWPVVILVFLSHLIFDAIKPRLPGSPLRWYIVDQAGHLLVLGFCAYWISSYWMMDGTRILSMPLTRVVSVEVQIMLCAYMLVGRPLTFGIGLFLKPWQQELCKKESNESPEAPTGLTHSGEWIGSMERFFTLTCVLEDGYLLVGAALIAKALMRYARNVPFDRKQSDYMIIGTFASVGSAILVGLLTRQILARL